MFTNASDCVSLFSCGWIQGLCTLQQSSKDLVAQLDLVSPKSRVITRRWYLHPIEGTARRGLPKWLSRDDLTHFVCYFTDRGFIPIDKYQKEIEITSLAGKKLFPQQRNDLFKHAAVWQKLLLKEKSVRGTYTSDSTNLAHVSGHGSTARDQPSTSPSYSQKVHHLQTRKGLSV